MKYLLPVFISTVLLFPLWGAAQNFDWKPVTHNYGQLPAAVKLLKSTDSLRKRPLLAYCITADLKDRAITFATQVSEKGPVTPNNFYSREGRPLVIVNTGYWSAQTKELLNLVMKDGKILAYNPPALQSTHSDSFYYPTRGAFGIVHRRADVAWIFNDTAQRYPYAFEYGPVIAKGINPSPGLQDLHTFDQWKRWKMRIAVGGAPVLVHDGRIRITYQEEQVPVKNDRDLRARTAIGYTWDNRLVILVIQGGMPGVSEGATLEEVAYIMLNLGCVEALNLEGGISSCLLVNGRETVRPGEGKGEQQPVPAVFMIRYRK